ncbi:MAG: DUF1080 domain-containing protein [Cytophagales bacterium]|nr:DUF1080 domain-containing protein [Cytophagales bacterium]
MKTNLLLGFVTAGLCLAGCDSSKTQDTATDTTAAMTDTSSMATDATAAMNTLSEEEKTQGFRLLFDGTTTNGWHSYNKGDTVIGWRVEDGVLMTPGKTGADLVTDEEFENFELRFDWNVEPKGNSGLIYKVIEDKKYPNSYETGPEYQIIDDNGYPPYMDNGKEVKINDKQKSGANYDMQAPSAFKANTPGEWNEGKLVINNNRVEHWLNGEKVVEYEYGGAEWKKQLAASKFAKWGYATPHAKGRIAIQDHDHVVKLRNVRIKTM